MTGRLNRRDIAKLFAVGGAGAVASTLAKTAEAALPASTLPALDKVLFPLDAFPGAPSDTVNGFWDTAMTNAIAQARTLASAGGAGGGFALSLGPREYKFQNTIVIDAPMRVVGCGAHTSTGYFTTGTQQSIRPGTVLSFPSGTAGIRVERLSSAPGPASVGGASASLENLSLRSTWTTGAAIGTATGIELRSTYALLRQVCVRNFSGTGIFLAADGNANSDNWMIEACVVVECGGNGLHAGQGADSSAGLAVNVHCHALGGWGFFDESFHGNTYLSCHASNNQSGNYRRTALGGGSSAAGSLYLGCYAEGDGPSVIDNPSFVLGGVLSMHATGTGGVLAQENEWTTIKRGLGFVGALSVAPGTPPRQARLSLGAVENELARLERPVPGGGFSPDALSLRYDANPTYTAGWWSTIHAGGTDAAPGLALSHSALNWVEPSRPLPANVPMFANGFFVGNNLSVGEAARVFMESGYGPPNEAGTSASGEDFERPVGSQVACLDPLTAGCAGWVKVAPGKGTDKWRKFGTLVP